MKKTFLNLMMTTTLVWGGVVGFLNSATVVFAESAPTVATAPTAGTVTKFDISKGFSSIAEKIVPSVVNISTTQIIEGRQGMQNVPQFAPGSPFEEFFREFFDHENKPKRVQSLGSGFIIKVDNDSAFIVTNYHVIADARKISVMLHDNTELEAHVYGKDERTDLALLKVKIDHLPADKRTLQAVQWGDSHQSKIGDWVLAVGNPFGLGSTVTSGIISNRSRDIGMRGNSKSHISEYVDDFMQHDASINMGNSGGPLFNIDGQVIGVNTAIFSPSGGNVGIGFAIPSAVAQETINQLLQFGRTKRGWLGVRIQNITDDMAESLGLGKARGAIVGSVTPGGPAEKAKIEAGDVILTFDGKDVNERSRLSRLVGETPVGKTVKIVIWRKGKEVPLDIVLGEFEMANDKTESLAQKGNIKSAVEYPIVLGLKLSALTPELYNQFKLKEKVKGIVVIGVDFDSPGAQVGLKPGDVIVEVYQKEVNKPEEFAAIIETAKKENKKNALLLVSRDGDLIFVPMRLEIEDLKGNAKVAENKENAPKK